MLFLFQYLLLCYWLLIAESIVGSITAFYAREIFLPQAARMNGSFFDLASNELRSGSCF